MKIGFFETQLGDEEFFKSALPAHELTFSPNPLTEQNAGSYATLEVMTVRSGSKITPKVIDTLPGLKYIIARITGFDNIDVKYANSKNIPVSNIPAYGENTVAEFAFGLILSLARKIPDAINRVRSTKQFDQTRLTGFDLKDKTLGVLGTGKIGSHLIQMAKGFEMKIIAFDAFPNQELSRNLGFEYKSLDEVLKTADIISVHVPYLPTTHHMLNSQNMPSIKRGAVLVNTARGAVIETQALVNTLEQGILSAAALDVLEDEDSFKPNATQLGDPTISNLNNTLLTLPQVFITPHLAFDSKEALQRILQTTVENLTTFEKGTPQNLVKPPA